MQQNGFCEFSIRGIGIDAISIDKFDSIEFEIHNTILSRGRLIIENLNNLDLIKSNIVYFGCNTVKNKRWRRIPIRGGGIRRVVSYTIQNSKCIMQNLKS